MKTLSEILLDASPSQRQQLGMVIDKIIPSGIIEKRLDMLKKETPEALLSLIKINSLFKFILLFEVMLVEDMVTTGIYKLKFGKEKCSDIINMKEFFPKDSTCKGPRKFEDLLDKKNNNLNLFDMTLYDASNSLTLGGKILLIKLMDRDLVSSLITSNKTKYSKKELINALEVSKNLRNHIAHNSFVLNKGPYLKMVNKKDPKLTDLNDEETIKYLFSNLEKILKISSRGKILIKIKKEIKERLKAEEETNINLIDCILLK